MSKALATKYELTSLQAEFVRLLSCGLEPSRAVEQAGYSGASSGSRATDLLRTPTVLAAIHMEIRAKLVADAPIALAVIERLIKDEKTPPKIRLDAAKTLLDRAGHIAPRAIADRVTQDLALNEMTLDDLRRLAERLEGEIAGRAKDVGGNAATLEPDTARRAAEPLPPAVTAPRDALA